MTHTQQTLPEDIAQDVTHLQTAAIIAKQNDAFRTSITASPKSPEVPPGKLVMTAGVAAQSDAFRAALIGALIAFDAFDADSDPYGLHEMGVLEIEGERVWFKFDGVDAPSHNGIAMCQTGFVDKSVRMKGSIHDRR